MAGPKIDLANIAFRNVVLMALNSSGELEPVFRDGNALEVTQSAPQAYEIIDIVDHTFQASGVGHTFGPMAVVEDFHSVNFWVVNNTATNNVVSVQLAMFDDVILGPVADSEIRAVPGAIDPNSFYVGGLMFSFDFNSQNYEYAQIFRGCILGIKLAAAAPAQSITVGYRGLRY